MHEYMKTITLTEEAYQRLKDWKEGGKDSFSKVVLKVVPERGTLGQMLTEVQGLSALSKDSARVMEEAAAWGRQEEGHRDPWTS